MYPKYVEKPQIYKYLLFVIDTPNPGVVNTGIFKDFTFPLNIICSSIKILFKTPEEGSQTTSYVAMSSDLNGISGKYFSDCKESKSNQKSHSTEWQKILWKASKRIVKLTRNDPII